MALITCKECGAQVSEFAEACPSCGSPIAKAATTQQTQQTQQATYQQQSNGGFQNQNQNQQGTPPKTWLVESILVTVLCCLPFGIAGIINATKVESRWYAGDKVGAEQASADAKKWTMFGLWGGIIVGVLYGILVAVGAVGSIYGRY